jgi:hypothetical protein
VVTHFHERGSRLAHQGGRKLAIAGIGARPTIEKGRNGNPTAHPFISCDREHAASVRTSLIGFALHGFEHRPPTVTISLRGRIAESLGLRDGALGLGIGAIQVQGRPTRDGAHNPSGGERTQIEAPRELRIVDRFQ